VVVDGVSMIHGSVIHGSVIHGSVIHGSVIHGSAIRIYLVKDWKVCIDGKWQAIK
jgi:hypothetical protein